MQKYVHVVQQICCITSANNLAKRHILILKILLPSAMNTYDFYIPDLLFSFPL